MPLPVIETDRLRLVPFDSGDVDAFERVWGDPEVIWWGAAQDRAAAADGLARLIDRCGSMSDALGWSWLHDRRSGEVVGDVVLQPAPDPPGGIEIGWHLAREHWGKGYATEGSAPLIPHAWDLGLDEVIATIIPVNTPSIRVAERLGMQRRGPTVPRGGLAHGIWVIGRPNGHPGVT